MVRRKKYLFLPADSRAMCAINNQLIKSLFLSKTIATKKARAKF
jgi:hypothetical protein